MRTRNIILTAVAVATLAACAGNLKQKAAAAKVAVTCGLTDKRLRLAFADPGAAKVWLRAKAAWLSSAGKAIREKSWRPGENDVDHVDDLLDLVSRIHSCIDEAKD